MPSCTLPPSPGPSPLCQAVLLSLSSHASSFWFLPYPAKNSITTISGLPYPRYHTDLSVSDYYYYSGFFFLEQFKVHSKIEGKLHKHPICALPHHVHFFLSQDLILLNFCDNQLLSLITFILNKSRLVCLTMTLFILGTSEYVCLLL